MMWFRMYRNGKRGPRHEQLHRRSDELHDAKRISQRVPQLGGGFSIQVSRFFLFRRGNAAGRWFCNLSGAVRKRFNWSFLPTVLLAVGVKESTLLNNIFTALNLLTIAIVIIAGGFKGEFSTGSSKNACN